MRICGLLLTNLGSQIHESVSRIEATMNANFFFFFLMFPFEHQNASVQIKSVLIHDFMYTRNTMLCSQCLRKWGFRRCEDICWIKTNKNNPGKTKALDPKAVFQRTKVQHIHLTVLILLQRLLFLNFSLKCVISSRES